MKPVIARSALVAFAPLFVFLALLCTAAPAHGQDDSPRPVPLAEYERAVHSADALLEETPDRIDAAQALLEGAARVELRPDEIVDVAPLLSADEGATLEPDAAQRRLSVVSAQLEASSTDETPARLAVLEHVLNDPAFQNRESFLDWLRRWLARLFERWTPDADSTPLRGAFGTTAAQIAGWAVILTAAGVLIFLLGRWIQTLLATFVGDSARTRTGDDELPATPAEARHAASLSAQRGDFRSAVRHLYLASLLTLQDRRVVSRDASLTNREVLARTPAAHPVHTSLRSVVDVFDDVWYGVHEPDRETFERYRAAVDDLDRASAAPAPDAKEQR